MLRQNH